MRGGTLAALGVAAIALGTAAWWVQRDAATGHADTEGALLPELMQQVNDVDRIRVVAADGEFNVTREEGGWTIAERAGYAADLDVVRSALLGLARMERTEAKTSNPELYSKLDLQDPTVEGSPAVQVQLLAGDQSLADVILGRSSPSRGDPNQRDYYVRAAGNPQSWLVETDTELSTSVDAWLAREVLELEQSRIRAARVRPASGDPVVVVRVSPGEENFELSGVPDGKRIKYQFAVNDVARSFASLQLEDVAPAAEVELEDAAVAAMETYDGLRVTLTGAERDGKYFATLQAAYDSALTREPDMDLADNASLTPEEVQAEAAELNARWQGWVYELPGFDVRNITKPFAELVEDLPAADNATASQTGG